MRNIILSLLFLSACNSLPFSILDDYVIDMEELKKAENKTGESEESASTNTPASAKPMVKVLVKKF